MGSFIAELKRRNLFRVGVAYAVLSWLLIQVAETVLPTFHAPEWVLQTLIFIIILGFPLAIFLAWAYELTPEGIRTATSDGPDQYHTRATGQQLNYFILGVVVLAVAFLFVDNYFLLEEPGTRTASSVAGPATPATAEATRTEPGETLDTSPASTTTRKVRRSYLGLGQTQGILPFGVSAFLALSRDGGHLLYVSNVGTGVRLYHRRLEQLDAQVLSNIVEPRDVFFSPDGEWAGFTTNAGGLYKVSLLGGTPQQLAGSIDTNAGGYWSDEDVIYFSMNGKLHRIPAVGGEAGQVDIMPEHADWSQGWPYGLPGGTHMLFTVTQGNLGGGHTALLSLETGESEILIRNSYNARYAPSGHILFMRNGSLWAVPFDARQLKTTGPQVPVINGVETNTFPGIAGYSFSDDGLLAYLPGEEIQGIGTGSSQFGLVWVDRDGNEAPLDEMRFSSIAAPRISPDGRQVAVGAQGQAGIDIWTYDLDRGTYSRRTFEGNANFSIWTPDGKRLVYSGTTGTYWTKADGSGQPELIIKTTAQFAPYSFTPDGAELVCVKSDTFDIHVLSMTGEYAVRPLITSEFVNTQPAVSPDGRWIAYVSTETGADEVYVRPYPVVADGKWQISTGGGMQPRWRGDGKELFYAMGQYAEGNFTGVASVAIDTETGFHAGKPEVLFTGNYNPGLGWSYDVTADGQRFIILKQMDVASEDIETLLTNLVVVENWFEELKRLAPSAR